jgi:hypothetical protein
VPFDANRYKNLIINAKVDVGASTVWGESVVISSLDNLLNAGIITPIQYLKRLPKGTIPDITGLIDEISEPAQNDILSGLKEQYPDEYDTFASLSKEEQQSFLNKVGG